MMFQAKQVEHLSGSLGEGRAEWWAPVAESMKTLRSCFGSCPESLVPRLASETAEGRRAAASGAAEDAEKWGCEVGALNV